MLTVMCPNCRHRFPAPGCCNPVSQVQASSRNDDRPIVVRTNDCAMNNGAFYGGGYLLVPREYNENNHGCFINAPTIIHGPTIIQQPTLFNKMTDQRSSMIKDNSWLKTYNQQQQQQGSIPSNDSKTILNTESLPCNYEKYENCHINTTCDLTGGTVTITTPNIQSDGCLLDNKNFQRHEQSPRIEIRPRLWGGGCLIEKTFTNEDVARDDEEACRENSRSASSIITNERLYGDNFKYDGICPTPPSGCQELPGTRRFATVENHRRPIETISTTLNNDLNSRDATNERESHSKNVQTRYNEGERRSLDTAGSALKKRDERFCSEMNNGVDLTANNVEANSLRSRETTNGEMKNVFINDSTCIPEIRLNATLQLPSNIARCIVNITATTGSNDNTDKRRNEAVRTRDNFNGGGLIDFTHLTDSNETNERRNDEPTTPVSWLMPCPWTFENYPVDSDVTRLNETRRLLQIGGWYHGGISWQQSDKLLKNSDVGRWLMRDSSDSRFIFAISVQTSRGPTSVRVHYFLGKFRLDAEPRLSLAMPLFECPVKMLQHYVDYSKIIDERRKEVWVDYSGQLYSQIYLTKPLVKEVQSLSHLARIVANREKLSTEHLPNMMKNYLAEYPYSL